MRALNGATTAISRKRVVVVTIQLELIVNMVDNGCIMYLGNMNVDQNLDIVKREI